MKKINQAIASLALKTGEMAKWPTSFWGIGQPKEPKNLSELVKKASKAK